MNMKKIVLIAALIAGFSVMTAPVYAFDIGGYRDVVEFKFSDFTAGTLYQQSSNGYGQADGTEDAWSIFKVSTIKTPSAQTLWFDGKDGEELTGIFYGLDDDAWTVDANGLNVQSIGGIIDVYLDNTPDFDPTGGPGARTGASTYPTVTDGELFLRLALVPGIKYGDGDTTNDHITYDNDLDSTTSPFTGDGAFYLVVIGGSAASMFDSDAHQLVSDSGVISYADFFGQFDTTAPGRYGWLATSEDPISGRAVPEPTSMLLLGSGLFGLAGLRRKK
jgi:hypothetical protein